jgi:DNA topoisomerase-1
MIKDLKAGSSIQLDSLKNDARATKPPPRFSEVSLIKTLSEEHGIGRPSTFSSIVSLIQDRGYVTKQGGRLVPTFLGFSVVGLLTTTFPTFTAYSYTSSMEEKLDEIADNKVTRVNFLSQFWDGATGFHQTVQDLTKKIDYDKVRKTSTIDLHNGFSISYNKFGAFLQDNAGAPNEKGYLPSVKIDEDSLVDEYVDREACVKLYQAGRKAIATEPEELGALDSGVYKGWTVTVRAGKFGPYAQAVDPSGKNKPINQGLDKDIDMGSLKLADIEHLFAEVKLPRNLSPNYFTGIGKRGPWLAFKKTPKSKRAEFVSLPSELDPRTITIEEAQKVWEDTRK